MSNEITILCPPSVSDVLTPSRFCHGGLHTVYNIQKNTCFHHNIRNKKFQDFQRLYFFSYCIRDQADILADSHNFCIYKYSFL
jgi:hypothetical protein